MGREEKEQVLGGYSPGTREMIQKIKGREMHTRSWAFPVEVIGNTSLLPSRRSSLGFSGREVASSDLLQVSEFHLVEDPQPCHCEASALRSHILERKEEGDHIESFWRRHFYHQFNKEVVSSLSLVVTKQGLDA